MQEWRKAWERFEPISGNETRAYSRVCKLKEQEHKKNVIAGSQNDFKIDSKKAKTTNTKD